MLLKANWPHAPKQRGRHSKNRPLGDREDTHHYGSSYRPCRSRTSNSSILLCDSRVPTTFTWQTLQEPGSPLYLEHLCLPLEISRLMRLMEPHPQPRVPDILRNTSCSVLLCGLTSPKRKHLSICSDLAGEQNVNPDPISLSITRLRFPFEPGFSILDSITEQKFI